MKTCLITLLVRFFRPLSEASPIRRPGLNGVVCEFAINQSNGVLAMGHRVQKGCVGLLILMATYGVHAQGGGVPISPEQASAIVAAKTRDQQLAAAVTAALTGAGVDNSKVKVRARNGAVMLRGAVPTADQVQTAITAAQAVQGVTGVKNHLRVRK